MVDGKINEAVALEKFSMFGSPDQAKATVEQCKGVAGANPCEIAQKFVECSAKMKPM